MKAWCTLGMLVASFSLNAQPLTLINTLPDRPVFNLVTQEGTETRTVAPGSRIFLAPGLFSGLGEKRIPLSAGVTYYLARFGALPRLYKLDPGQVLIVNQAGRAVSVTLSDQASAVLAEGNFALGGIASGGLAVTWDSAPGQGNSVTLETGGVYRFILDSPPGGIGTLVNLVHWNQPGD